MRCRGAECELLADLSSSVMWTASLSATPPPAVAMDEVRDLTTFSQLENERR